MADKIEKNPVTPEMNAAVGKTFALKNAEGDAASRRFKVAALIPGVDFGPKNGGRRPAFEVHRLDKDSASTPPAADFLATHEIVAEPAKP